MAQISRYIEAPYNGVSQAPPQVRPENMAEAVEDTLLAIPQGAIKRPPFDWQGRLGSHPGHTNGLFEVIEREGSADAFLTITNAAGVLTPRVYLAEGFPRGYEPGGYAPQALTIEAEAQAYLNLGNPDPVQDLVALTVEDYTFILNRKATVGKLAGSAPERPKEAIVWVRQAAYARVFTVTVTPTVGATVTATLRTPNGKESTDAKFVDTEVIASTLTSGGAYTAANEAYASGALTDLTADGFTVTLVGPVIYIAAPDGVDFTVDVSDGQGGNAMLAIKDRAQRFSDLPQKAVAGFTLRITQQSGTDQDDFFVEYQAAAGAGSGVWAETIGPGAELGMDPETLPVGLVFDGGWQLKVLDWKPRGAGDQVLAPDPAFVGQTIKDINFWRGRLALLGAETGKLSSAADPLSFYPSTLSTVTDSDPIELVTPLPGKGSFSRMVPFDSRLIMFADQGQAAVQAQGVLTPDTASIDIAGAYEYSGPLRPLEVGERLYFLAPRSQQASVVYELEGGQDSQGKYRLAGDDLTAAVPRYVPAGIDRASACAVNYLVAYAKSGQRWVYPHLFRYASREKVQNAWSRWWLPEGWSVGGLLFRNTRMYVLACRAGETHLVMADIAPGRLDPDSVRLLTHLDFRLDSSQVSKSFSAGTGLTTVNLPYSVASGEIQVTVSAPGVVEDDGVLYPEGLAVEVTGANTKSLWVAGDFTEVPLWVGFQYSQVITPSTFYALGADNRPQLSGRLSVRRVLVDLAKTGYLRAEVRIGARAAATTEFTGLRMDSPDSQYDQSPEETETFSVKLGGKNTATVVTLINDSHLPSAIVGMEWRGELNLKA